MLKQLRTWKWIGNNLRRNVPVVLLYVLHSEGSSPGRQGFFMGVNANGEIEGSIGGGVMEHKFVEIAKERFVQQQHEGSVHLQVHNKQAFKNQSGMICSGEQTVLVYPVQRQDALPIKTLVRSISQHKNGTLHLSVDGVKFYKNLPDKDYEFFMDTDQIGKDWTYTEKTGYKNHLYIIGGGHCALALSKIMGDMNFYIHLIDHREGLHTITQNTFAHDKKIVEDYSTLNQLVPPGESHYVIIMTFGYRTDYVALKALMKASYKYIGVLGSAKKIEKMFADYRSEGVEEKYLKRIAAPVGIQIKSETPEEIAISIAAHIIRVKNAGL